MFLSREEAREVDRRAMEEWGIPGLILMENAGRGAAELLRRLGIHGTVIFCCGKGNNGGDGFVMARHLDNWQIPVRVLLFTRPEELTGDAATSYQTIARSRLPIEVLAEPSLNEKELQNQLASGDWVVDALFGTGLKGPVRHPFGQVITAINASLGRILAVDIPSGLDCDTGQPLGPTVRAHSTATFVALKKGFANPAARQWLGKVYVLDIGAPSASARAATNASS
ncbi:MAG TPA: NAD(P)H-hydrate epimerase [Gemmataceae bacterium]|nr:NAD(P)H-hydrate epimerase [Gemmataceae bacterium]